MTTPVISGDGIFSHVFIGAANEHMSCLLYTSDAADDLTTV